MERDGAPFLTPRLIVVVIVSFLLPLVGTCGMLIKGLWLAYKETSLLYLFYGVPLVVYVAMSLSAWNLYEKDKRQAQAHGWRTSELTLHTVEMLGGWPGALIAQQWFRHKTRKQPFQLVFWLIVLVHQVLWVVGLDQVFFDGYYLLEFQKLFQ